MFFERKNTIVIVIYEAMGDIFCMVISLTKFVWNNLKNIVKYILIVVVLCFVTLNYFTLSPQWCLSKEQVWRAEEIDLTLYVSENYKTEFNECFSLYDRDELREYVTGKLKIGEEISSFAFNGEDHFKWIRFGNVADSNESWSVVGEFKSVFNSKRIRFMVNSVSGNCFPKNIDELTFVPVNDYA